MTDGDKHSSLLRYGNSYGREKFYGKESTALRDRISVGHVKYRPMGLSLLSFIFSRQLTSILFVSDNVMTRLVRFYKF